MFLKLSSIFAHPNGLAPPGGGGGYLDDCVLLIQSPRIPSGWGNIRSKGIAFIDCIYESMIDVDAETVTEFPETSTPEKQRAGEIYGHRLFSSPLRKRTILGN